MTGLFRTGHRIGSHSMIPSTAALAVSKEHAADTDNATA